MFKKWILHKITAVVCTLKSHVLYLRTGTGGKIGALWLPNDGYEPFTVIGDGWERETEELVATGLARTWGTTSPVPEEKFCPDNMDGTTAVPW